MHYQEETGDGSLSPLSPLSLYYKLNDIQTHKCYIRSSKKRKRTTGSGKEKKGRLCCRSIQTNSITHIACLISRGQLCRPPATRNGLFAYALIRSRPDQVDVWSQTPAHEPCNKPSWRGMARNGHHGHDHDQIKMQRSTLKLPLVRKDRRLF